MQILFGEQLFSTTRNEWKINSTTVTSNDRFVRSRLDVYAQESEDDEIIRGVDPGVLNPTLNGFTYTNTSSLGEYFLASDAPGVFMSYSELMFLVAEAAKKGYISGGDATAKTAYEAGIRASFDTYNGFVNEDKSVVLLNADAYIATSAVAYNPANALTQIATQNYIALYGQGQEAYTEWRRTKIPALSPAKAPLNGVTYYSSEVFVSI